MLSKRKSHLAFKTTKKWLQYGLILSLLLQAACSPQSNLNSEGKEWQAFPKDALSPEAKIIQDKIPNYQRLITSTYLTYPEWYIVYSSREYANFLKSSLPSGFPYFSSISQYWWGYYAVNHITKGRFPKDSGDHLMLLVIGTSYSVEYLIKGLYENSIGRFTEWLSHHKPTAEDRYAQKVAEDYVNFIPNDPWFEFPYGKSLSGLWTETSLIGPSMIRKIERKIFLSTEYSAKAIYAAFIRFGSHLTYGSADPKVYALVKSHLKASTLKPVQTIGDDEAIIALPSEQAFTEAILKLINRDVQFKNIAGNNEILVTALAPKTWTFDNQYGQLLFTVNILTQENLHRIAIRVPVVSLLKTLDYLQKNHISIEHVYAY